MIIKQAAGRVLLPSLSLAAGLLAACDLTRVIQSPPERQAVPPPFTAPASQPPPGIIQISTSGAAGTQAPDISGDRVVWIDDRTSIDGLYLYDAAAGTEQLIALGGPNPEDHLDFPSIDGDLIGFTSQPNGMAPSLMVKDLNGGDPTLISGMAAGGLIDGRRIAYGSFKGGSHWQAFVFDYSTMSDLQNTPFLEAGPLDHNDSRLTWISPYGDPILHWVDLDDPQLTDHTLDVSTIVSYVDSPRISGNLILFSGVSVGSPPRWRLLLADLETGAVSVVETSASNQRLWAQGISGSTGVWVTLTTLGEDDHGIPIEQYDLYVKDVFSPAPAQYLARVAQAYAARIDGTRIAFTGPSAQGYDVFLYNLRRTAGPPMPPPQPPLPPTPPPPPRP
jgi:beta propeller repeat protein